MRSGGRKRTAFLPFPKTCLWNKSVLLLFGSGSKSKSRGGPFLFSSFCPAAAEGAEEQDLWPLWQGKEWDALCSCRRGRKRSMQVGTWCNGKCSTRLPGKLVRSRQFLGGACSMLWRAGHPFQVTGVLSEWGIWNLTQSRWAWCWASPRNTKTVYCNHSKAV